MKQELTTTPISKRNRRAIRDRLKLQEMEYHTKMVDRWKDSVPDEYVGKKIVDIESGWHGSLDAPSKINLMKYVKAGGDSRFLVLQGATGVGKTTLAVTLATHFLESDGVIPEYRLTPTLLQDFSFGFQDGVNHLRLLSHIPLLILDDLGAGNEHMTPHQQRNMWALIDQRWSHKNLRTIITTNMATSGNREGVGMREWLGETAWDRVSHDMLRIQLKGESLRTNVLDGGRFDHL